MDDRHRGMLRLFKGAPASVLIGLLFNLAEDGSLRPMGLMELSRRTGWSHPQVREGLIELEESGLVVQHEGGAGWSITEKACIMLLEGILAKFDKLPPERGETNSENWSPPDSAILNMVFQPQTLKDLKDRVKEEDLKNVEDSESLSPKESSQTLTQTPWGAKNGSRPEPSENPPPLSPLEHDQDELSGIDVSRVLDATADLFGEPLLGSPSRYKDTRLLLAWIADAYAARHRLRNPARVAYAGLKAGRPPRDAFLRDPSAHLPARFLEAAGIALPPWEDAEYDDSEPDYAPEPEPQPDDPSLHVPLLTGGTFTARSSWEHLREQLRSLLMDGMFNRWVRDSQLMKYEERDCVFHVLLPDEEVLAFWEDRLRKRIEKQLIGYCGTEASLELHLREEPGANDGA